MADSTSGLTEETLTLWREDAERETDSTRWSAPIRVRATRILTLLDALAATPAVEIHRDFGAPATCKVWLNGALVFDGQDRSELLRVDLRTKKGALRAIAQAAAAEAVRASGRARQAEARVRELEAELEQEAGRG